MKKILLTESEKKAIILEREKAIIANFAKAFNSIKRIDENDVEEGWGKNLAAGALAAAGSLAGGQAQAQSMPSNSTHQTTQQTSTLDSLIENGGAELGSYLISTFKENPQAARQWETKSSQNKSIHVVDMIKSKDAEYLGNIYGGENSNLGHLIKDFIKFIKSGGDKTTSL